MENKKVFNILSYIGPLFLISLFIPEKNNPTTRLHCGQGMILCIVGAALSITLSILAWILFFIPVVGLITVWLLSIAVSIALVALNVIGIVNAATDKHVQLPIIGKYAFYK